MGGCVPPSPHCEGTQASGVRGPRSPGRGPQASGAQVQRRLQELRRQRDGQQGGAAEAAGGGAQGRGRLSPLPDAVGGWAAGAARTTPPAGGTAQGPRSLKDHGNLQLIG
ncbi:hypothetical protein Q9966_016633 [Columba livia]|nr:hypothetical protein Q9966_016633 [Columba livia]